MKRENKIKQKDFIITIDKDVRGLGYTKIKQDTFTIHTIMLFMFIIAFTTPRRLGKRQIANWNNSLTVEISGNFYNLSYYGDISALTHIYYRNSLGTFIKATKFHQVTYDMYLIFDDVTGKWITISNSDVYIFKPDSKLEGYINGNEFIVVKELSIG